MNERGLTRYVPLTGIAAVILGLVGAIIRQSSEVASAGSAEEILAAYQGDEGQIITGGLIFMIGVLFFLWFLGFLRAQLYAAEGGLAPVSATAFGGGLVTAAFLLILPGGDIAGAIENDEDLTAPAAQALSEVETIFFIGAEFAAVVFVIATGLVALRTGVLPRWFGWVSFLLGLWLLIAPVGWAGLVFGLPIWILLAGFLLWTRASRAAQPAATPTP